MFQIIGIVLLFGMVFGGYTIAGGKMGVILHSLPYEMMMIGGAAVAALVMSNSVSTLKGVGGGFGVFNLGTGSGVSVLQLVAAFSAACGKDIPYRVVGRRPGDVPSLVADPGLVDREWGWRTERDLAQMCDDAWRFQKQNPAGYSDGV